MKSEQFGPEFASKRRAAILRTTVLAAMAVASLNMGHPTNAYACTTCEWSCGGGSCSSSQCLSYGGYDSCTTNGSGECSVSGCSCGGC
jgi:hypothetical protein